MRNLTLKAIKEITGKNGKIRDDVPYYNEGEDWVLLSTLSNYAVILERVEELQTEYNNNQYSRTRKIAYDLLNQDEMRFDDVKNSTTTWVDAIDAIKAAHPKP
jgi:hypothetical protein